MRTDRTFAMIKPDAIERGHLGEILFIINRAGFNIVAMKMTRLSADETKRFYSMHQGKDFFEKLASYISSGPVVPLILEKENAVDAFRKLIGATNPEKAEEGTIRKRFAVDLTRNSIHGADSPENACREWSFFFPEREIG
ncbi:MAG: nucleoside-diphosphate kinase [Tenuifilaceae bacterium]|jgi:nucleoside-diphosphate kinase|nr:nucleoside-diphosphate kinase [Bacteroidales bacterium]MDI9516454.1 nucleoside-diphosphate kinase [Bacteroidota bacterium]NLH57312.1 nucleoside-diphosphate kinase [Rikenellaceae bacterium]OQC63844.1 MAG: Nucleoside diphosphate kinase [Bacteroidetes bacterium ADurb.Bin008]HNS31162.1 nucleoside-diphosphate kinase [Tenuifilaceae bacterium]